MLLAASIPLEIAVTALAFLTALRGRRYLYGLAFTFAVYVVYDTGRLFGWHVQEGGPSVLFLLASASAAYAVWGLYRDKT